MIEPLRYAAEIADAVAVRIPPRPRIRVVNDPAEAAD